MCDRFAVSYRPNQGMNREGVAASNPQAMDENRIRNSRRLTSAVESEVTHVAFDPATVRK